MLCFWLSGLVKVAHVVYAGVGLFGCSVLSSGFCLLLYFLRFRFHLFFKNVFGCVWIVRSFQIVFRYEMFWCHLPWSASACGCLVVVSCWCIVVHTSGSLVHVSDD